MSVEKKTIMDAVNTFRGRFLPNDGGTVLFAKNNLGSEGWHHWVGDYPDDDVWEVQQVCTVAEYNDFIEELMGRTPTNKKPSSDIVRNPKHYQIIDGVESIHIIASSMSEEAFKGFCLGNIIKYRLRAGNKDNLQQEIDKANFYVELFEQHKHLCKEQ